MRWLPRMWLLETALGVLTGAATPSDDPQVTGDASAYSETYTWNYADGTLASMVDGKGHTWSYTWDANNLGNLLTETDPASGLPTRYDYTAQNRVEHKIDQLNRRVVYTYSPTTYDLT